MNSDNKMICSRCNVPMKELDAKFTYLGKHFSHKVLRCPSCGQVFFSEELVNGKVKQLEYSMEEK